jgi:hypothetical protein|tara:strand:+ start:1575 stop:1784 length:210 start_codon:yes stop_codon:yes gene_type:complete
MTKIYKDGVLMDMTPQEEAEHTQLLANAAAHKATEDAAKTAADANTVSGKQKLKDLGLTDDEIKALTGN